MALADIIVRQVKNLSKIVDSFKGDVQFYACIGESGAGVLQYAAPVTVRALVDVTRKERMSASGGMSHDRRGPDHPRPIADTTPNTGFDRKQPVDTRDKFVLPDGTVGSSIIEAGGFMDAATSRGFINELLLGSIVRGQ
jgi:hypothetical protein